MNIFEEISWDERGLVPVIVQDADTKEVLMLAYMNKEALEETLRTGKVHFYSRKRQRIWMKGEESGNVQEVKEILVDCDKDALLVKVKSHGPACHTGRRSCFFTTIDGKIKGEPVEKELYGGGCSILERLYEVILERKAHPEREDSYTALLFRKGLDKILKKVGEESTEVVIACKNRDRDEIIYEVADLFYHTLVALGYFDIAPHHIYEELKRRFGKSGLRK
ncbi:MAG: bifunctional phosphoribosyl-AMP cyclohydrolase/phosphoribosyl-ATP diphosphatase HisIE [Deferribacteres bacterium]|nr:bifunctional phosphoribosyl-AMP cyclohydrolase/phosphoribosyl-ATP diphosphatase HisIE [Deferribacteres bacterium]